VYNKEARAYKIQKYSRTSDLPKPLGNGGFHNSDSYFYNYESVSYLYFLC